jgi:hypothetical protein
MAPSQPGRDGRPICVRRVRMRAAASLCMQMLDGSCACDPLARRRCAQYISLFVDEQLRKGMKGTSEEEVETILDKVVMLFRYLQEKDVFEKYYKQHLAKRLLGGRSMSDDAERSMIGKLKIECGYQYTSKLEGMFMDMKVSADTQEAFRNAMGGSSKVDSIELSVHVLTTGFWPTQVGAKCSLPPQILRCCDVFKEHYLKQHSGRRLQWQANMGSADLKAVFSGRKCTPPPWPCAVLQRGRCWIGGWLVRLVVACAAGCGVCGCLRPRFHGRDAGALCGRSGRRRASLEPSAAFTIVAGADTCACGRSDMINVSTYQTCVLLLFNPSDTLTYTEIAAATEIPGPDLQRALQSLACAKFKILNKEPKGRNVEETDTFTFNAEVRCTRCTRTRAHARAPRSVSASASLERTRARRAARVEWPTARAHRASLPLAVVAVLREAFALQGGHCDGGEGDGGGEAGDAAEGRRGPQAADRGGHRARDEEPQGDGAQCGVRAASAEAQGAEPRALSRGRGCGRGSRTHGRARRARAERPAAATLAREARVRLRG